MDQSQAILYPVPLLTRQLPSHVYLRKLLSSSECDTLITIADNKGYQHFEESRYGEAGAVQVETCEVTPDEADFVYSKVATTAAQLN